MDQLENESPTEAKAPSVPIGRRKGKNMLNTKSNKAPPETSSIIIAISQHPNTDGADDNDLKYNFIKIIEALKEE